MSIAITGIGTKLGSHSISLDELAAKFQKHPEKIQRCPGFETLHHLDENESLLDITIDAVEEAVQDAGISTHDIHGIVATSAGGATHYALPSFARQVGAKLNINSCPMLDAGSGCVGGIQAVSVAAHSIQKNEHYLVIVGQQLDQHTKDNLNTGLLFSEGVAAMVISQYSNRGFPIEIVRHCATEPQTPNHIYAITIRSAFTKEQNVTINGKAVYRFVQERVMPTLRTLINKKTIPSSWYFIPHQANLFMLQHMLSRQGVSNLSTYLNSTHVGNTSGASIFFGLQDARQRHLIDTYDHILLGAYGAGLEVGALVLKNQSTF